MGGPELLVPGFGMTRSQEYCPLKCQSQREASVQSTDSVLVSFHRKVLLPGESFVISKNCLALGGEHLPGQLGPRCQSIGNTENKEMQSIRSSPRRHASTEPLLTVARLSTADVHSLPELPPTLRSHK